MSNRYKGAIISATPPTTTGGESGVASGAWTLEQQMQLQAAGLWPSQPVFYIENVFSTYLYTGNGTTNTITNNIDLSTKGGLVWIKGRNYAGTGHFFQDTVRGANQFLDSTTTGANQNISGVNTVFTTTGFSQNNNFASFNESPYNYVSWTFRKQPKFFDIVTYTGNGSSQTINHNLGSVPGVMIVKSTTYIDNWAVYHRSLGATKYIELNNTNAASTSIGSRWDAEPTSTSFSVGYNGSVNASGETYVAYLFAHNAGGFGLTGTDNVISCGSYTGDGTTDGSKLVSLGYEPQWVLVKRTDSSTNGGWHMIDTMRGMPTATTAASITALLLANTSAAEVLDSTGGPSATGFRPVASLTNTNAATYIYIAIRRGPMKVPTTGTSVFGDISALEPVSTNQTTENGVLADLVINGLRINQGGFGPHWLSRLTGNGVSLVSSSTAAEFNPGDFWKFDNNNFAYISPNGYANNDGTKKYVAYSFNRAPSFFDVVCDTGTGAAHTINHNLGVAPQLIIRKRRNSTSNWCVYPNDVTQVLFLDATNPFGTNGATYWNSTAPTASVFSIGTNTDVNTNGGTYVNYLFATCAGVSKVGSYTGTATTLQVDCGFTGGARFVLIKRTDSAGDWYVWDSARGIVAGNDPYLLLNTTAAEVTNTDYVDTYSAGFEISSTAPAAINANGGTFIFLAIA